VIDVSPKTFHDDAPADQLGEHPRFHPPKCYACDADLDTPGRGDVPLCLRCRAGDGERTPGVEATFLDLMEKHATRMPGTAAPVGYRTEARCGKTVTAESSLGLNKALDEHSKACVACCAATFKATDVRFAVNGKPVIPPADWDFFVKADHGLSGVCHRGDAPCWCLTKRPSCRLCPMPAETCGYCQSCWCGRLTESDRKEIMLRDPYRPKNPEDAAASNAFFEQLVREFEAVKAFRDQIDRDYERSFKVLGVRRDDRDELGDGSEDEEC
jgi:hypothetical protein